MSDQVETSVLENPQDLKSFQQLHPNSGIQSRSPRIGSSSLGITEVDSAESEDGSLLEMIEDPDDRSKSIFAISKNGGFELADRVSSGGRVLVPIPRDRNIIRHVRLPRGIEKYDSTRALLRKIMSICSRCLDLPDIYRVLLSCLIVSTWVIDQLVVAPYIALIGLPRSGKSTALELLNLLCRRGLLTADISSAAFYRVCDCLTPTLLIDETSTAGDRRTLFHLLRTGTTRETTAIRKNESFKTFGAKGISWTELPNDPALNSRCILIPMEETRRTNLIRPSSPEIVQAADQLQRQLLQFRFEKYKQLRLPQIEGAANLHSRARDLYEALALACGEDTETCNCLAEAFRMQQDSNREPLLPTQSAVLQFLYHCIHEMPPDGSVYILSDLTKGVNRLLQAAGEDFRMKPRAVGAALSSLGFTRRKRTNMGFQMILDKAVQKRVHHLIDLYGIDNNAAMPSKECRESCEFCRELALTEQCGQ